VFVYIWSLDVDPRNEMCELGCDMKEIDKVPCLWQRAGFKNEAFQFIKYFMADEANVRNKEKS